MSFTSLGAGVRKFHAEGLVETSKSKPFNKKVPRLYLGRQRIVTRFWMRIGFLEFVCTQTL